MEYQSRSVTIAGHGRRAISAWSGARPGRWAWQPGPHRTECSAFRVAGSIW